MSADLLFEPGSQYHYSSTGHYLLACILEKLTGRSYEEILRERILGPLGLKDTAVETPGGLLPKRAGGYVKVPGGYANAPNEYAPNLLGTGNLFSTVEDLYAWNCALRSGRLLPDEWQRKMLTVYWPDAFGSHAYVLNHYVRRRRSGESLRYTGFSGALPGFASDAFHFTDEDLTVVLLDNTSQYNQWAIAPEIHAIVTGAAVDMPRPPASDVLAREAVAKDIPAAVKLHQKMHKESAGDFDFGGLERELNTLGYNALAARMLDRAITVFKLNTELFPDSWNVYDSLGEAYGEAGETALSAQYYAKAETIKHREDRLLELVRAGEYDAVVKELRELRLREPNVQVFTSARIGPLFGRAFEKGDNEQALAIARVWALGNPKALGPYFSQSRVFERLAKPSDAALCYQRILELAPEGPHVERVRQALARLETAGSD